MVSKTKSSNHSAISCNFCNKKVLEKQRVFFNEYVQLIYPKKPIIFEHLIIIPNRHITYFFDLSDKEIVEMRKLVGKLFHRFKKELNASGFNLYTNNGRSADQHIPHVHWHIFIRFDEEKFSPHDVLNGTLKRENISSIDNAWKNRKNKIIELMQNL